MAEVIPGNSGVTIKGDGVNWLKNASRELKNNLKTTFVQEFQRLLISAQRQIEKRTRGGQSVEGSAFKQYSTAYRNYKFGTRKRGGYGKQQIKSGKVKIGGAYSAYAPVNLELTGDMLGAIGAMIEPGNGEHITGKIYFIDAKEARKARVHNEGIGKMPKRHWFDLSEEQQSSLFNKITRLIKEYAGK